MFHFKHFSVKQNRSAMKISTDSVLLGAWTPLDNPLSVLDIGAGTGVLSLMIAQRTEITKIDAVEVDNEAFTECFENFSNSLWKERLNVFHQDIKDFYTENNQKYDLIISNPPFFTEKTFSKHKKREIARFTENLPFDVLLKSVSSLLSKKGFFSVIIPFKEENLFIEKANYFSLYPCKIMRVKGNFLTETKRSLILFSFQKTENISYDEIIIEKERHIYTEKYINLTKNFYLNF
ncbi:MAG: methyltransferase [Capnocytophaga sp.]|nr:methyltransferase [Capnocytophaga sp.]